MDRPRRQAKTRKRPPLSPALRAVVEQAYRSRERQVRDIVARCRRLYPHYRALSGPALESLWKNVRYLVAGFYRRGLVDGGPVTAKEVEPITRVARFRAAQGVPLDAMIGCYELAFPILWEELIAAVGPNPAASLELLRRLSITLSNHTRVITAVTEAYIEERERLMRSREQAVDELLRLLLAEDVPLGVVEVAAREVDFRLDVPRVVALFHPIAERTGGRADVEIERLRSLVARTRSGDVIVGRVQEGILALIPARADHEAVLGDIAGKLPKRAWRVGVGDVGTDATGLRRSAREAKRVIDLGGRLGLDQPVLRYADLALLDLVDIGSPRAHEFAHRVLGPLASSGTGETYRKTLRVICRNGFRLKVAAAALGIHPNTMSYRLAQIRHRFGIDLDDPETRVRLHLALLILDAG